MKEKSIFIGTLFSGENELDQCIASVKAQTHRSTHHEIIKNLPNKEAHDTLYRRFMELSHQYDYFIKLDADMVFEDNGMIEKMIRCFTQSPDLDHAIFSVRDWYAQMNVFGLHMFSNRVTWPQSKDHIFVDHHPDCPGIRKVFNHAPAPVAIHNPNPTLEFAWTFGQHRALKVVQRDRWKKQVGSAEDHFRLLKRIYNIQKIDSDPRRVAVILGAESVFSNKAKHLKKKSHLTSEAANEISRLGPLSLPRTHTLKWEGVVYYYRLIRHVLFYKYILLKPLQFIRQLKGSFSGKNKQS